MPDPLAALAGLKRFTQWCTLSHGHLMAEDDTGGWVRFADVEAVLREASPSAPMIEEKLTQLNGELKRLERFISWAGCGSREYGYVVPGAGEYVPNPQFAIDDARKIIRDLRDALARAAQPAYSREEFERDRFGETGENLAGSRTRRTRNNSVCLLQSERPNEASRRPPGARMKTPFRQLHSLVQKWRQSANEATTADAVATYLECARELETMAGYKLLTAICEGCGTTIETPTMRRRLYAELPAGWSECGKSRHQVLGHGVRLAAWCPKCRAVPQEPA